MTAYQDHVASIHEDGIVSIDDIQASPPWALDRIDQTDLPLDQQYHYYNLASDVNVYVVDTVSCSMGPREPGLLMRAGC